MENTTHEFRRSRSGILIALALLALSIPDPVHAQNYPPTSTYYAISGDYVAVLGRRPDAGCVMQPSGICQYASYTDAGGWMYWTGMVNQGLPLATATGYFLTSNEYTTKYTTPEISNNCGSPPTAVTTFLTYLYNNAFASQPGTVGCAYWIGAINWGLSWGQVADEFVAPGGPPYQFDSLYGQSGKPPTGNYANTYCAGYSTPTTPFTASGVTVGAPAAISLTYVNNACGGTDMLNGLVLISPPGGYNLSAGRQLEWAYSASVGSGYISSITPNLCTTSGTGAFTPNGSQFTVNLNFTIVSASLAGSQEVYSFAFDNQGVGNGIPSDLGPLTVAQPSLSVALTNTSRANSNTTFYVGDGFDIAVM